MSGALRRTVATDNNGVALGGFDPVSYFSTGRPLPGDRRIAEPAEGARWWFANQDNRNAFRADPRKYMPEFGGHCVLGVSRNQGFAGEPSAWTIRDGRLYLSTNRFVRAVAGPTTKRIAKAHRAWADAS